MAFVHDDEVEELRRDAGIVDNFGRLTLPWLGRIESRTFLVSRVELGLTLKHRIEPLDRGDDYLRGGADRVRLEPLDGVESGELGSGHP